MPYSPRYLPTEGTANTSNWEQLVAFRFKGTALEGGLEEPTLFASTTVAIAFRKAKQKVKAGVATLVEIDTTSKDPGANISLVNHNYVAPAEGYYQVSGQVDYGEALAGTIAMVYVNKVERIRGTQGTAIGATVSGITFLKAKDTVELETFQESGAERELIESSGQYNYLHVVKVA